MLKINLLFCTIFLVTGKLNGFLSLRCLLKSGGGEKKKKKKTKEEEIHLFSLVTLEIGLFDWLIWGSRERRKKKKNPNSKVPFEGLKEGIAALSASLLIVVCKCPCFSEFADF